MSNGLSDLPVTSLVYQRGSEDIIYAATDAGVYRWEKDNPYNPSAPSGCWIKFNGKNGGGNIPNLVISDLEIDYCNGTLLAGSYGRGIWESTLYLPDNLPGVTETITQNTTWSSDKAIEGSILVQAGKTLTISGTSIAGSNASSTTIYMPWYGRIYVEKGAKLIIDGAKITNGCGKPWVGIQVFGASNLNQQLLPSGYYQQGYLELKNNAILENAEDALNNFGGPVWYAPTSGNSGGIIVATDAYFYNCRRTFQFTAYSAGSAVADASSFTNCHFEINDNYMFGTWPIQFQNIGTMWAVKGISFTNCKFYNLQTMNFTQSTPFDHGRGMFTINAGYKLNGCEFKGFVNGLESSNYSLGGNLFLEIKNSLFNENQTGIRLPNTIYPRILSNTINVGKIQSICNNSTQNSIGTYLYFTKQFNYSNNTTNGVSYTNGNCSVNRAGMTIYGSGPYTIHVEFSNFNNLKWGNLAYQNCANVSNKIVGLNYRCNTNTGNQYDFHSVTSVPSLGLDIRDPQDDGTNTPGQGSNGAGNVLSLNSLSSWYQMNNYIVKYYYENLTGKIPSANSNIIAIPTSSSWCSTAPLFVIEDPTTVQDLNLQKQLFNEASESYTNYLNLYNSLIDAGNTEGRINEIRESTSAEALELRQELLSISPFVSLDVLTALAQENVLPNAYLLEVIMANPDAHRGNMEFITFLQSDIPNPLPSFMINLIRDSWVGETTLSALMKNMASNMDTKNNSRAKILLAMNNTPSLYNSDSVELWMKKRCTYDNQIQLIEFYLENGDITKANQAYTNFPSDIKMTPQEMEDYNEYAALLNFKISLLQNGKSMAELNANEISDLVNIAEVEGFYNSSLLARNALCFFYGICFDYPELENGDIQNRPNFEEKRDFIQSVMVYPNPAREVVYFYFNMPSSDVIVSIYIFDANGKMVLERDIQAKLGLYSMETQNLHSGNYFFQANSRSGIKYSGKFSIVD